MAVPHLGHGADDGVCLHYVQNTGPEKLVYLEPSRSDRSADVSLTQWLALTPPELVKAHLNIDDETIAALSKAKPTVVG
jgi:oxalate decarboxylase/phosphoglucose isomerase-like protein (cupin superfamily)